MSELLSPSEVEHLARARGLTIRALCREVGIAPSTFTRWKSGETEPTLGVYRRIVAAVAPTPTPAQAAA
jgi:transcriptional regulator with XRE-family HTH domain